MARPSAARWLRCEPLTRDGSNWALDAAEETEQDAALSAHSARRESPVMAVNIKVNGAMHSVPAEPDTPLLYVLRNDLGLNAAKFGCGVAQCGACTVLVDGRPVRSCATPIDTLG